MLRLSAEDAARMGIIPSKAGTAQKSAAAKGATDKDSLLSLLQTQRRSNGLSFEEVIEAGCDYYRTRGIADIDKTPEPMRPLRNLGEGQFIAVYTKSAQPDFKGILNGGLSIVFEAKQTSTDRMLQSRVTEEQTKKLAITDKMGGVAFVLCAFDTGNFYRVPWNVWSHMQQHFGHKYATEEELRQYKIKINVQGALLFLEGLTLRRGEYCGETKNKE